MSTTEIINLIVIINNLLINSSLNLVFILKALYHCYKAFFFVMFPFLCLIIADVSLYGFLYKIKILSPNSPRTIPLCTIITDAAVLNLFLAHFSLYKLNYTTYLLFIPPFTPFILFFNIITLIPDILLVITFCAIFMNFYFGIENIVIGHIRSKRKDVITIIFHIIVIANGILAIPAIFEYLFLYQLNPFGFIFSLILGLCLTAFLKLFIHRKELKYPFEAIEIWLGQGEKSKKKKEIVKTKS